MTSRRTILVGLVAATLALSASAQQNQRLTILHLTDSHANAIAGAPRAADLTPTVGGLARVATFVDEERKRHGDRPLLVLHSGDFSVGDPIYNVTFGVPELQLLAHIGVDAMAVGNHEFDLTPFTLLGSLGAAFPNGPAFPLLSANLDLSDPAVQGLQTFVLPYVIRDLPGLRVGIFGLTTPVAAVISQPAPVGISAELGLITAQTVGLLEAAGCDVVILLSHLGLELDTALATAVPGIDVVLGGHDHYELDAPRLVTGPLGDPVTILQNGGYYRQVGHLELRVHRGQVLPQRAELVELASKVGEDPVVRGALDQVAALVESLYPGMYSSQVAHALATFAEKVGSLDQPGRHDAPVANFVADALRAVGQTDFAICPSGATAQPLHAGPVVQIDLYRMAGYGYNTVNGLDDLVGTFTLPGFALRAGLEFTLAELPEDSDYLVHGSDGFRFTYDPRLPPGNRLLSVTLHGAEIQALQSYTITANYSTVVFLSTVMGLPVGDLQWLNTSEFEAVLGHASFLYWLDPTYPTPRIEAVFL